MSSGKILFGIDAVLKLIPLLQRRNAKVLGLEGFVSDGRSISPTEYIADFSDARSVDESLDVTKRIVRAWIVQGGPHFVEVIVE